MTNQWHRVAIISKTGEVGLTEPMPHRAAKDLIEAIDDRYETRLLHPFETLPGSTQLKAVTNFIRTGGLNCGS